MLHPAAQILLWIILTLALQLAKPALLLGLGTVLLLLAMWAAADRLRQLLRRTRWIMLTLLVIYAWTTPGIPLLENLPAFSPTLEGVQDGALQLGRLFCALAALAILLTRLDTPQLISGVYWLCWPLRFLGLARDRLAVRLALTLHYAESAMFSRKAGWRGSLEEMLAPATVAPGVIELPHHRVGARDGVALGAGVLFLLWVWL
ncbi:CbiQ family ECF transporter T component [Ferriphaselus sp. R-1]|uniref:CbiQ family ECF transporter T component n=1 Tax=Ferriphaselus sp. R-1 TaxID=1485544 RepID=UPI00068B0727|nr:CbiQ family ECF transporter T component [Ferriphaselus sp. R-1]